MTGTIDLRAYKQAGMKAGSDASDLPGSAQRRAALGTASVLAGFAATTLSCAHFPGAPKGEKRDAGNCGQSD